MLKHNCHTVLRCLKIFLGLMCLAYSATALSSNITRSSEITGSTESNRSTESNSQPTHLDIATPSATVLNEPEVFSSPIDEPAIQQAFQILNERLQATEHLSGEFEQQKFMSILSRPMMTNGRFDYQRNDHFSWIITSPLQLAYHVKNNDIYIIQNDQRRDIHPRKDPVLHGFLSVFVKVLGADYHELNQHFSIYYLPPQANNMQWKMGLKPKNILMKKAINYLLITGKNNVEQLTLVEPNNDFTEILFSADTQ